MSDARRTYSRNRSNGRRAVNYIPEIDLGKTSEARVVLIQEAVQEQISHQEDLRGKFSRNAPLFASCSAKIEELGKTLAWLQERRERR